MTVFGLIIVPLFPPTKLHFFVSEARVCLQDMGQFIEEVVQCVCLVADCRSRGLL